ncbi:MAG TPA: thioesterase family protein [Chitinophagaceae bacterium]|nr:thioesterase family protein [Chitinophagaceae bacterium]
MARVKIELPASFQFTTMIAVRITDLNYGGHVGNDTVLSIIHEARMQFLQYYGHTEMNFGGTGMIMSDVGIEFKNELFYGDNVKVSVAITGISKVSFELYYKLEKEINNRLVLVATARTGMVCYNYETKKMAHFPEAIKLQFIT